MFDPGVCGITRAMSQIAAASDPRLLRLFDVRRVLHKREVR